ncbi:hypothetical protein OG422_10050 [Streptomyces sp. NBC_01525]|uniref:Uncharacterized protein n=1 Tax=Streptomyces benahoarensis TaxID=2595054 RepID=A0A553Z101_9ACTN|nr:hypothetical protein [Streptomyces benahoarensis]TSB22154.1 hypothetical protein FNJ62_16735 [Streptomyces benahoarensis]TSB35160.1 hypothetical protein FNZ23_21490 [Streptomyces benahoarensis]
MTVLRLADAGEAADLAAFLARLLHYDKAAAVRLQGGGGALAVFGRPPSFEVLAIRTARLADPRGPGGPDGMRLDTTVSAGDLLEAIAPEDAGEAAGALTVPAAVTGPPWAGVLPPRGGWRRVPGLPGPEALGRAVAAAVAEFRARDEALAPQDRTRAARDAIGREIWSRTLGDTRLPLRAVHAARSLGFLRPAQVAAGPGGGTLTAPAPQPPVLLAAGGWLRLSTAYGSVAVRVAGPGLSGLTVTPT